MANDKNTCFLFHKWDGCTCSVCGKVRDSNHSYFWRRCSLDDCVPVCTKCGKALQSARAPHDFRRMEGDCRTVCVRCGEKGRPEHQFEQAEGRCVNRCRICGYEQEIPHRWREIRERCELVCTVCGETQEYHAWELIGGCRCRTCGKPNPKAWHSWEILTEDGYTNIRVCRTCGKRDESAKCTIKEAEERDREMREMLERMDSLHDMRAKGIKC